MVSVLFNRVEKNTGIGSIFSIFVVLVKDVSGVPEAGTRVRTITEYSRKVVQGNRSYDVTILGEMSPLTSMKVVDAVI